jgi:hypothetical protein
VNVTGTTVGVKNNSVQVTSTEGGTGNTSNASITVFFPTHVVIPAATGNGDITLDASGSGCGFTAWAAKTEAQVGNDASFDYPYGLVEFTLNCAAADVTITFPGSITGTTYRKYGPTTPGNPGTAKWYTFSVTANSSTSVTLQLADGQFGDDTAVDGTIVDAGGPGLPLGSGAVEIPTMNEWGIILFISLAGLGSIYYLKRRRETKS